MTSELDEVELLVQRLLGPVEIESIRPCPTVQRHRSWSLVLASRTPCWLKIGVDEVAVAGVRHEAEVLHRLGGRWSTPRLLANDAGRPCTLTAHLPGTTLAAHDDDAVPDLLPGA